MILCKAKIYHSSSIRLESQPFCRICLRSPTTENPYRSAEFAIRLRKEMGICNSHRLETSVFDAMFCRLATMRVANSRYNRRCQITNSAEQGGENPTPPKNSREIEGGVGMIVALFMFYVCIIVPLTLLSSILQFQSKSCVIYFPLCYR